MISEKAKLFTESVIRQMTHLCHQYDAINLAQGYPDFEAPSELKQAAIQAIDAGHNQYGLTWGSQTFRQAIARKMTAFNHIPTDSEKNVTVTCGATEAMMATMLAIINPGDEVIIFEPFYENYGPDTIISGAKPIFVPLRPQQQPDGSWMFAYDTDELRMAFNPHTKAIILNTPNNPLGKVFTKDELQFIANLCVEFDCLAVTDEIYERILYDNRSHISIGSFPKMRDRTVTICGLSKTYSVTGWRVAYAVAPEYLTNAIRKMHDFLTVAAPAPFQEAGVVALSLKQEYYDNLKAMYEKKRRLLFDILTQSGFQCYIPEGAYYIITDISNFGFSDDIAFAHWLVKEIGVGVVPGSSFYSRAELGRQQVRFTFSKTEETLRSAGERLMCRLGNLHHDWPIVG